ncbi:acyltransferase [Clostridium beijerinckii]|uniref:Membrane-bound acyltransferase YfiQ involved in biofilm formation n=1 Tax=Clostridium beijerinckii TaxID=1520 RepID=A0AAX0B4T2_CLOBE|nr:acyltransferase [Clostridium beijerinckii]NRT90166.1 membrane-bound acyltransferase YfiQ involved in biofilm formation [Clostridium beijerinckii]NYC69696.1 membrane-bound acyltransferase YfiQ involved in biofilm formation [Clostridium beijerinckii]UYZ35425.1 acyltransferase [Clostridium beijerinckii]
MGKRHIAAFDYLRIFFCFAVVAWHTNMLGVTNMLYKTGSVNISFIDVMYYNVLLLAVPVFMQIALYLYLKNRLEKPKYFLSRIKYLFVVYIFWTILSTIILQDGGFKISYFKDWKYILTGAHTQIYFIFSLIIMTIIVEIMIKLQQLLSNRKFIALQIILLGINLAVFLFRLPIEQYVLNNEYSYLLFSFWAPTNFLPYTFLTFIAVDLQKKNKINFNLKIMCPILIVIVSVIYLEWRNLVSPINVHFEIFLMPTYGRISVILSTFIILLVAISNEIRFNSIVKKISDLTFSIFLVHYTIMLKLQVVWPGMYDRVKTSNFMIFLAVMSISLTIAYIFNKFKIL